MKKEKETAALRQTLEKIFKKWKKVSHSVPAPGWISSVREALDMSEIDLATRMKVATSTVSGIQDSERKGTVSLSSLRRAAEAMDCRLFYAIVPRYSLDHMLNTRRKLLACQSIGYSTLNAMPIDTHIKAVASFALNIPRTRVWKDFPKAKEMLERKSKDGLALDEKRKEATSRVAGGLTEQERQEVRAVLIKAGIDPDEYLAKIRKKKETKDSEELEGEELMDKPICPDTLPGDENIRPGSKRWDEIMNMHKEYVPKFRD